MFKKIIFSILLINASSLVFASGLIGQAEKASGGKYGMAGCGLGALLFGDTPGMIQIIAATTNGIYYNQTFAMTSGTSNCTENGVALKDREQEYFAEANYESLKQEMAQGNGQTLNAFSSLFGCENSEVFGSVMQQNYEHIFGEANQPLQMLEEVRKVYSTELVHSCKES